MMAVVNIIKLLRFEMITCHVLAHRAKLEEFLGLGVKFLVSAKIPLPLQIASICLNREYTGQDT